jgi:NADH dehydrogenase (ubiquinone) 1 alpha subcomplex subunit 9
VQLAGPAEYSYKEVAEFVLDVTEINRKLQDIPYPVAMLGAQVLGNFINPFLTPDALRHLTEDNVAINDPKMLSISDLGIEPASMDKVAFDYLRRFRRSGHFTHVKGYYSTL